MIDTDTMNVTIIDWGLAEFYIPHKEYNVRVASRPFKPPEILSNSRVYDYSFDMWSLGCLFAGMLFRNEFFFGAKDNTETMLKIIWCRGSIEYKDFVKKYDLKVDDAIMSRIQMVRKVSWEKYINSDNNE